MYKRQAYGDPTKGLPIRPVLPASMPTADRIMAKVDKTETCWLWTGALAPNGYGVGWNGERTRQAHRLVYELLVGPIPEGKHLDHLCCVRNCVNPDHLEPVTQAENNRRVSERRA